MANQKHLDLLKQGVEEWNEWRKEETFQPDLSGAELSGADLSEINLYRANLYGARLMGTILYRANLIRACLDHAFLAEANLRSAQLSEADCANADLRKAKFMETILRRTDLSQADLSEAVFSEAILCDLDLQGVCGLERVRHLQPSTIDTRTLFRSEGKIPEAFLRGAGVPEQLLIYLRSLASRQPVQYYTCFISYSSHDQDFAEHLYSNLQGKGIRCWFAPEHMEIGDKIRSRIEESIRLYDKLVLVLSEHSITSNWVAYEVERALSKEPEGIPNVLYPIRLDNTVMQSKAGWADDIRRTRHIGDFTHWKNHDDYKKAFNRLLRALKAETQKIEESL